MLAFFLKIAFTLIPVIDINILEHITEKKFNWSVNRSSPDGQETNPQVGKIAFSVRRQSQGEC